jgi:UDP-2,4-diacetamido-2,4,6-trideoxy-beta-L-altropyranose hydrolase
MDVFVRADASPRIGTGHVMRCMALSRALAQRGARISFVCRELPASLAGMIEKNGFALKTLPGAEVPDQGAVGYEHWLGVPWEQDALETRQIADEASGERWLIVDHYGIDHRWEDFVRTAGLRILVIDDLAQHRHACDLLLNQNLLPDAEQRYEGLVPKTCRVMLGPEFALLREEFGEARQNAGPRPDTVNRLLVFLGGSDPDGVTHRVLRALDSINERPIHVTTLVGAANSKREKIEKEYAKRDGHTVLDNVDNMTKLLADSDLAIGAGGISTWERCCVGLPAVVVAIAENQVEVSRAAADAGAIVFLGSAADLSEADLAAGIRTVIANPGLRTAVSQAGQKLVDGQGCERVATAMSADKIQIRRAGQADAQTIYEWRNAQTTRRYAHDPRPIAREAHAQWLRKTIEDPDRDLLIGETASGSVGVIRYDVKGDKALVSIFLDPGKQGMGYGVSLLLAGEQWLRTRRPHLSKVIAEVKSDNHQSLGAFQKAGFAMSQFVLEKALSPTATPPGRDGKI